MMLSALKSFYHSISIALNPQPRTFAKANFYHFAKLSHFILLRAFPVTLPFKFLYIKLLYFLWTSLSRGFKSLYGMNIFCDVTFLSTMEFTKGNLLIKFWLFLPEFKHERWHIKRTDLKILIFPLSWGNDFTSSNMGLHVHTENKNICSTAFEKWMIVYLVPIHTHIHIHHMHICILHAYKYVDT